MTPSFLKKFLVIIALGIFCIPAVSFGENDGAILARGLSPDEVKRRLGDPDGVRHSDKEAQWIYGHSLVFFNNDTVVAWSDAGELAEREQLRALSFPQQMSAVNFQDYGWSNAWTMEEPVSAGEVVEELTEGMP